MPSQTEISTRAFEEKLKNKPKSLIFSRLADSYRKSGDVQQAISICSEGLALHPEYVTGRIILGRCYLEQENFNDAIKEFTKVCKLDRRNQITIKMLADVFSKQGMEEKAGDLYNLLLNMDPDNPSIMHLANVFKGSNKRNLFEILGIEEDIKVEPEPSQEPEHEQDELQAAQDVLDEIEGAEIDQEVAAPDALPEEEGAVTEPSEAAAPEAIPEEAAVTEPTDEAVAAPETAPDSEKEAVALEAQPEEAALLETVEDTAVEPESITEDITVPEIKSEAEPQTEVTLEEEPSLDDILSQELDTPTEAPLMEDIQVEEEPLAEEARDIVAETEVTDEVKEEEEESKEAIGEIKEEPDKDIKAEKTTEPEAVKKLEPTVTPDQVDQVAERAEEELPGGDDISERMGSMFGEDSEDLAAGISEITESEIGAPVEELGKVSTASKDITDSPEVSELSSRIEDMFGGKEEVPEAAVAATEAVTEEIKVPQVADQPVVEEMDIVGPEEELPEIDSASAPTVAIDKEVLAEIRELDSDSDIIEKTEEDITDTQITEPELLGISEELEPSIEDISEEREISGAPTEVIDLEDRKKELVEEPSEIERPPEPLTAEIPEEFFEAQKEEEEITDTSLTEATALFDRDTIQKLASDKTDELTEVPDTILQDVTEDKSSVSGEDVTSRLDEMFTADEGITETEVIEREPAFDESVISIEQEEELEGEQIEPMVDEQLFGEDVASRIDEMFVEDDALEDLSIDTIPDEVIEEDKTAAEFYTETGDTASIEDKEETMEGEEEILSVSDTVFLNVSPAEELDIVDDQSAADEMSLDTIPDEDSDESEATGEFYTETGETAFLEDKEGIAQESKEIPVSSDIDPADSTSADEIAVLDDEIAIDEMLIDSIPDETIEDGEATGVFYTESGDVALDESGMASEKETEISEPEESITDITPSGEDVAASLEKMFPEDQLTGDSLVDIILDEDVLDEDVDEKATVGDGFYNVSGEEAETALAGESELPTFEEKEEKESVFQDDETFFYESEPLTEVATDLITKAESIPDHVLTPTLADIYFQQDQPHLAIQIYKRLLERDPDNDKIVDRIAEIEQVIEEKEALIEKTSAEKAKETKKGKRKKSKSRKKRVQGDARPLKGVRIKKEIKELIKRAKQELEM